MRTPALMLSAAALVAALAGCAGTRLTMLGEARPAIDPAAVRLYDERPAGAIDIAELESRSGAGFGTAGQRDAVLARLRREAAAVGANGVLLLGGGRQDSGLGIGLGAGNYGRHGGVGVGTGLQTTQEVAHGVAIWVPGEDE